MIFLLYYRIIVGIRGKDGVVFGVEKFVFFKLYEYGVNKRIIYIDNYIGMVSSYFSVEVKLKVVREVYWFYV